MISLPVLISPTAMSQPANLLKKVKLAASFISLLEEEKCAMRTNSMNIHWLEQVKNYAYFSFQEITVSEIRK